MTATLLVRFCIILFCSITLLGLPLALTYLVVIILSSASHFIIVHYIVVIISCCITSYLIMMFFYSCLLLSVFHLLFEYSTSHCLYCMSFWLHHCPLTCWHCLLQFAVWVWYDINFGPCLFPIALYYIICGVHLIVFDALVSQALLSCVVFMYLSFLWLCIWSCSLWSCMICRSGMCHYYLSLLQGPESIIFLAEPPS